MVKKFLPMVLIITLVTTALGGIVFAEVTSSIYTKTQIEELMRNKLNIQEEMKLIHSNLTTQDTREKQLWHMEFQKEEGYISITAEADTGEITRFHQWDRTTYDGVLSLLPEDAKNKASEFIENLQPKKFRETEEVSVEAPSMVLHHLQRNLQEGEDYYFMFVRKLGNEFFPNNYFRIQVSGISGEIVNYEMNWDEATYKDNRNLISEKKARNIFEEESRLNLKYVQLYKDNKGEVEKPILTPVYIYEPKVSDIISGVDGRLLTKDEIYNNFSNMFPRGYAVTESMAKDSTSEGYYGRVEMIPEEGVMSKETAEKLVMNMLSKNLNLEDMRLQNSGYSNQQEGIKGKFWSFYWQNDSAENTLHAVLNTEKKNIVSVNYNTPFKPIENREYSIEDSMKREAIKEDMLNKIDEDTVAETIANKIKEMFPEIDAREIKLEVISMEKNSLLDIRTVRYIDDIPYDRNYINITYDIDEDKIVQFHYKWIDVEAKSSKDILSRDTIEKKFYDAVGFERYLIQLRDQVAKEKERLDIPLKELYPVYALKDFGFAYIDAKDGSFLNFSGEVHEERELQIKGFKDLENHPYRNEIILMNKMGVLQENNEAFYPDETLLRQDALKWIMEMGWRSRLYHFNWYNSNQKEEEVYFKDMNKDHPYYKYIQAAVENHVIENTKDYFKPLEAVEKIEITRWILNAMEQKELAQFTEIFKVSYSDIQEIDDKDIGYVALAKFYDLFANGKESESFQGQETFTRGKFVSILYTMLKNK
ncbi:MAG: S-layer homology domain-containing protein [Clostridiaceae bacterium]|nr:S-layer homology domain-containing protein [Clostridiaceae bacterium]